MRQPDIGFVGRAAELDALADGLDRVRRGQVRVVVVEGPGGIGKTTLVRHFLGVAGIDAVYVTGDEMETRLPYGVVEQIVGRLSNLPPLLRDLRSNRSADPLGVGAELIDLVGMLQREKPLAIVLDDAQWADPQSLHALTFALRRAQADPILGILATRDAEMLPEGFRRIVESERGARIRLGGFAPRELVQLAATMGIDDLPVRSAERLHGHTDGNPLHARTLLEELPEHTIRAGDVSLPAPRSYAVLVLARLAACPPEARALMTAAAVLGAHAPLGVAARLADLDDPLPALEEATNAGLLEAPVGDGPRTVAFTHPLARAAVYHDLGAAQRAELHRRAAEIVGGPDALDHRVAATPLEDAELADDLEADARRLLAEGMVAAAASRLVASARLAPDPSRRGALVLEAAERLLDAGDAAEAAGLAGEIGSFAASAARSYILGQLAMFGGQLADAERLLVDAWDQARASGGDRLAARAAGLLAQLNGLRDCLDDASKWARRALALTDDLSVTSTALSVLVGVLAGTGRADEAIELADDVDSAELQASSVEVLQGRGLARLWTDDLAGARADITAVVRAGRRAPAARSSLIALGYLAEAEFRIGAWDDSVVHADLAVSLARDSDQPWLDGFVHAQALWVLAARGDWERAAAYAATATAPGPFGEPLPRGCIGAALAHLAFCRGEPAQVVAAVQPLVAQPQRGLLDGPGVYRWRELYVDALVTLGYLDEAEAVLGPFERLAVAQGRRSCLAVIEQARARIAAARGDDTEARAGFELALEHAQSVRAPFEQASVEDAYGRYLRRAGERRAAAELLGRARDVYLRLGARPFVEPVERELQGCGLTPAGRRSPEPTRLTPQELAVARLVASGLTNRETAAELVVSVKTVEYHLGHVYQKLGVRSRTELAGQFATSGAPQDSPGTD